MGGNVKEYYSSKPRCVECHNRIVSEEGKTCLDCGKMISLGKKFRDMVKNPDEYTDKEIGRHFFYYLTK